MLDAHGAPELLRLTAPRRPRLSSAPEGPPHPLKMPARNSGRVPRSWDTAVTVGKLLGLLWPQSPPL